MRDTLVAALVACADQKLKAEAHRFLAGLSSDELQFIAEFVGACILESSEDPVRAADAVHREQCRRMVGAGCRDREIKLILLHEYLLRSGLESAPPTAA